MVAVDPPVVAFAGLLRQLRTEAGLSQEELAAAAGVGVRTVSDLERGVAATARKDTARLLADALNLTGTARASFEAVARGRAAPEVPAALGGGLAGAGGVAAATRTLPRDTASFTGRQPELRQLVGVTAGSSHPGVVAIHAIGGMAGIGKTAFAVHAAHQLAPRFPDGQIFLPLHAHTPGHRPVDPADALASLLQTAGIPAAQIPPALEARMALWRDHVAGKQLLLLLDDAADSEQVRPLLPGTPGSLVLVTSRRHLTALEDTELVSLDTLQPGEAAELLIRLAVRAELEPNDTAVAEITRLCGCLPLAVGMLARQLHHHPSWTLADLAADLAAARDRLELMDAENLSVAAAFDLSYLELTPGQQRLFRRLGLHPGTDIDAYAAAALDDTDLGAARRGLEALYGRYLITEPARGRYRLHDLIREHARALAGRLDPDRDRDQATARLLDYYQHTAARADALSARQTRPASTSADGSVLAGSPVLAGRQQALAWARAERASLLACLDHATCASQHKQVITLTAGLATLLRLDGPWAEAIARHATAIQAARKDGDQLAEANAHNDLGYMRHLTGDRSEAAEALNKALSIYQSQGHQLGQANAMVNLGILQRGTADYPAATRTLQEALGIYRELGDQLGQAHALYNLGAVRRIPGDYLGAAQALGEALGIFRDLGDESGQAHAYFYLGAVRRATGDYPGAVEALEEALDIYRDLGNRLGQANARNELGQLRRATGNYPGAVEALEEALDIYRDLGNRLGQAHALAHLGKMRWLTGDYQGGTEALANALDIYCDLGDRQGQAVALNEIASLHRMRGALDPARTCHQQALSLAREIEDPLEEAHALVGLAHCALAAGYTADAISGLRQAQGIFHRIGDAEADNVTSELEALIMRSPTQKGTDLPPQRAGRSRPVI